MGSLLSGGPPGGGIAQPGSLLSRARAANAAGAPVAPTGHWEPNPNYTGDASPPMMWVGDPAPAAAGSGTSAVGAMQNAAQTAAAAAVPAAQPATFPVPAVLIGTLGETGAASTAPTSRRRRAPNRGRAATLLGAGDEAESLGA